MTQTAAYKTKFQFHRVARGHKRIQKSDSTKKEALGRIPRITRLLALAIRLDAQLKNGVLKCQSEIAKLGHVSRPRVTQIMNFNLLAPDIQEEILFWPRIKQSRDPIIERELSPIMNTPSWQVQRKMWSEMIGSL